MIFLVDYENVGNVQGMQGLEYLQPKDTLIIFYSGSCKTIRTEWLEKILQGSCRFEIRKLKIARPNALDFYIAAMTGMLVQSGETEIAIVSRDKGFHSLKDFISSERPEQRIIIAPSIEESLLQGSSAEDKPRRQRIAKQTALLSLDVEFAKYQERMSIIQMITDVFDDTPYASSTEEIIRFFRESKNSTPKERYLKSLQVFGRKDGTCIYQILKKCG